MKLMATAQLSQEKLQNYNDLSALQQLKHSAGKDREAALDAVAKQFESLFVSMMIKSMRDANKGFSEGNLLNSSESEFYQEMFDSQIAVTMSTGKGIGLADVIKRQLSRDRSAEAVRPDEGFAMAGYQRNLLPIPMRGGPALAEALDQVDNEIAQMQPVRGEPGSIPTSVARKVPMPRPENIVRETSARSAQPSGSTTFASPSEFIQRLYPLAREVEKETGIDARLMLAQSALETGWGQHQIRHADGRASHNLFGIKASAGWQGDAATITTTEYRGGVALKERAAFRSYDSYRDSFRDYANFLQQNKRYDQALAVRDDPKAFAYALQQSGYATDPNYGRKLNSILDRYLSDPMAMSQE